MANKNIAAKLVDKAKQFVRAEPDEKKAAVKNLAGKVVDTLRQLARPEPQQPREPGLAKLTGQSLVWGTRKHTHILQTEPRPVDWSHRWVMAQLDVVRCLHGGDSLVDKVLVDLGSGPSNPVIVHYGNKVRHAYLIDHAHPAERIARGTVLRSDLEHPLPLPDASADLIVSTNALEHLSREGRLLQMAEIARILRPGGRAYITMSYCFDLDDRALTVLAKDATLAEQGNAIVSRLDVAEMLAAAPALRLLGESKRAMFPGFEGFDERTVRAIPGLLTEKIANSRWAAFAPETNALGVEWAVMGMALEKPPVGDTEAATASRQASPTRLAPTETDPRLARLLAACPVLEGKRVLVVGDDAGTFAAAIEKAGATVHSCVADMDAYAAVKAQAPERTCWVHDLDQPWNLSVGDRYDIVVAFDVLHRLADPEPFMAYVTQLAPQLVIDTVVLDSDDDEVAYLDEGAVRCAPSPAWIKERCERFDLDLHDLSDAVEEAPDGAYAWPPANSRTHLKNGQPLRRLYLCRRRRDALSPLLVHVHIQKSGGQSVNEFLGKHSWHRMIHFYKEESHAAQWDVFHRLVNEKPEPLIFSSHVMRFSFPPILGGRLALYFSIFRHPYDALFSYVKYVKKCYELQVPSLKKILPKNIKQMTVEEIMKWYLRNPLPVHFTGHILPVFFLTETGNVERAKRIVSRFFFVGITDEMQRSMAVLKKKLAPYGFHFPNVPWVKKNVTSDVKLGGYDIRRDQEFLDYAEKHLGHELEFYEWVKDRFDRDARRHGL